MMADIALALGILGSVLGAVSTVLHLLKKDSAAADVDEVEGVVNEAEKVVAPAAPAPKA